MTVVVLGGAAVAMKVRPTDSSSASSPLCRDTSRRFLPCRFFLFILFLPSPRLSLSVSLSISPVFWFLCFGCSSLSLGRFLSLSVSLPVCCRSLLSFFSFWPSPSFFCTRTVFIGAGERERPCPIPLPPMHGVHVACSAMAPTAVANGGVACGTQLLWHLILRWVASDFGSKACGRKRQGKKQGIKKQNFSSPVACPGEGEGETVPSKNGTVLFLFFFFLENA